MIIEANLKGSFTEKMSKMKKWQIFAPVTHPALA